MNPLEIAARSIITNECRHRYAFPRYSCLGLVACAAEALGYPVPPATLRDWMDVEDEQAAVRKAVRAHRSVSQAFQAVVGSLPPWSCIECDGTIQARVRAMDLLLLKPGLRTQNNYETMRHHVALIGPECRAWVWCPGGMAPVHDLWGEPECYMAVDPLLF